MTVKRLELARELLPAAKRVAVVWSHWRPWIEVAKPQLLDASRRLGLELMEAQGGWPNWQPAIRLVSDGGERLCS